MPTLDDFFKQSPKAMRHPLLMQWEALMQQHKVKPKLELQRPAGLLGLESVQMRLGFGPTYPSQSINEVSWNYDLNEGLVELGVRAADAAQEAQRFALAIRDSLNTAEQEVGDGYLNSVLLELIRDIQLDKHSEIRGMIQYTFSGKPFHGPRYELCRALISNVLTVCAHQLSERLGYSEIEAKEILVNAIALYLDARFSISSRRKMGLL